MEGRSGRRQPRVVPAPLLVRAPGRHCRYWAAPGRQHPGGKARPPLIIEESNHERPRRQAPSAAPRRGARRRGGAKKGATEPWARPRGAGLGPLPPPVPPWAHPGTSMRRYGSPIARRRARSRAAEHPKMGARAASTARAGVAEAKKPFSSQLGTTAAWQMFQCKWEYTGCLPSLI